ncbi:neprilysin-4-like [Ixodes scapularis]|uniref:neprilysin-4-like n=1 Tax=Ixodes scapularis TaxID=6945 RepID=UPI001C38B582|nr:neprilysin-4-like [Ixodes scapularis]
MYGGGDQVLADEAALSFVSYLLTELDPPQLQLLLAWSLLRRLVTYADGKFFASQNVDPTLPCIARVSAVIQPALWASYFLNEISSEAVLKAKLMVTDMKKTLRSLLERGAWLDDEARKTALSKLQNTVIFTGYPKAVANEGNMNGYYGE